MSWSIREVEFVKPHTAPSLKRLSTLVDLLARGEEWNEGEVYCGTTQMLTKQREILREQVQFVVPAVTELLKQTQTVYALGCTLYIEADGHVPEDTLNFEDHHIAVRISVRPVKFRR